MRDIEADVALIDSASKQGAVCNISYNQPTDEHAITLEYKDKSFATTRSNLVELIVVTTKQLESWGFNNE